MRKSVLLCVAGILSACGDVPPGAAVSVSPADFAEETTVIVLVPAGPSDKPLPQLLISAMDVESIRREFAASALPPAPLLQVTALGIRSALHALAGGKASCAAAQPGPRTYALSLRQRASRWDCQLELDVVVSLLQTIQPVATADPAGRQAWEQLRQWGAAARPPI